MHTFYINTPKKKCSGNSPPSQADAENFNMEVDGIDHVSVFFCRFLGFTIKGIIIHQ